MRNVKCDTEFHHCDLSGEPWDLVTKFIDGGIFVNLRRAFKRYTMISRHHPLTRMYAPSLSKFKKEEKFHLIEHFCMIHPLSMFNFHFNLVATCIIIFYFIITPLTIPFILSFKYGGNLHIPLYVLTTLLIILSFHVGYHDDEKNVIVLNKWQVAKRYLKTYFLIDLLLFFPFILRIEAVKNAYQAGPCPGVFSAIRLVIRYGRHFWCLKNLNQIRLYYGFTTFAFKLVRMVINIMVTFGLAIFILYALLTDIPYYNQDPFLDHIDTTLEMLFLISYGRPNIGPYNLEVIIPICFLLLGFLLHLVLMVEIMDICTKYFSGTNQQSQVYNSLNAYIRYRALPLNIKKRIYLYLQFKYQGRYYKETVIRKTTSNYLRKEILLAATHESIQKVDIFHNIPNHLLKKLGTLLVSQIFLPGDVIIKAGSKGYNMYFLLAGTVVVTLEDDKPICYLRDGSHFGEVALVTNTSRVANVVAVTPCELFMLDREHFSQAIEKNSPLWNQIEKIVMERIANNSIIAK